MAGAKSLIANFAEVYSGPGGGGRGRISADDNEDGGKYNKDFTKEIEEEGDQGLLKYVTASGLYLFALSLYLSPRGADISLLRSQSGHLSGMLLAKEQFKVEHNYQMGGVQCFPCLNPHPFSQLLIGVFCMKKTLCLNSESHKTWYFYSVENNGRVWER